MPTQVDALLSLAVVSGDNSEVVRAKRLLVGILWVSMAVTTLSSFLLAVVFGAPIAGAVVFSAFFVAGFSLLVVWRRPSTFPNIVHLIVGNAILISTLLVVLAGGFLESGANGIWGIVAVLGALVVLGDRRATVWLWVFVASQVFAVAWARQVEPAFEVANAEYVALFNLMAVTVFVYFVMLYYVRQRAVLLEESDRLLRNILPERIARRLKRSDRTIAESFDAVSVLFADIVDFTPMSARLSAPQLVRLLDEVFTSIDQLVDERGLEKIKTIGDAYMVAAGVPQPRPDHAVVLCDLAIEIRDLTKSRVFDGHQIRFRIGVNSGPLVAGVIGTRKFSYDLWGDVVNTASRMESSGVPGEVQVTNSTRRLVEHAFVCESRGRIAVKGKGSMETWTLTGRR
jgi:guanylate cyclase